MAISQRQQNSKPSSPSKFNSKLKQKKTWEKRLTGLPQKTKKVRFSQNIMNGEPEDMDRRIVCFKGKKKATSGPSRSVGVSTAAEDRAKEVQANLPRQFPSFWKTMSKSHVTGGFWLSLPKPFCDDHLPNHDELIILVDEEDQAYEIKYLIEKNGFSGGWRGFSIAHDLLEGDVLVFQLINRHTFKVYIVRASNLTELDGAIGLLNLESEDQQPEQMALMKEVEMHDGQESPSSDCQEEEIAEMSHSDDEPLDIDISGLDMERSGLLLSVPNFHDLKSFEEFNIHIDHLILDKKMPMHMRTKYYELCLSQNMFLHENLIGDLNTHLKVGTIQETVNIADGIRAVKATTPLSNLETWDKTLEGFEKFGMAVGFLRARIHTLLNLSRESQAIIESREKEKAEAEEVMRGLKDRLLKLREVTKGLDKKIEALKARKEEELDLAFNSIAGASW